MDATMDAGVETEVLDGGQEIEQSEPIEGQQEQQEAKPENPYEPKSSREYSQWLKGAKEKFGDDPQANKFLRLSKDNHARLYQLQQMEPKGIDGIREKYAMLDSVVHGELKGVEAIGALQDELRGVQEIDERLFAGDAAALKEMGPEFVAEALPKLAGPILEMVRESNPEAYAAAVLPHFVEALKSSELVSSFNSLVDVLNQQPPSYLNPEQKQAWAADQIKQVMGLAGRMGSWFNAQQAKAGELPKSNGQPKQNVPRETSELETLRKEQETQHWNTNITPKLDQHAEKAFDEQFRPYAKRLGLGKEQVADLKAAFVSGVVKKAAANPAYTSQIQRYHSQRKPDPNTVLNFAKVEFDKHKKTVMDGLVNARFKSFLNGPRKVTPTGKPGAAPVSPGVQIVTVKPNNIDFKNTPITWMHEKKYRTTDGKVVQVRN